MLVGLSVLFCAGWFGYERWTDHEQGKIHWAAVVDGFRTCSLIDGLHQMGKPDLHQDKMVLQSSYEKSRKNLTWLITSGYREGVIKGLDNVWLDPDVPNSLSETKTTIDSINLLSRCDLEISEGNLAVGLDLAYYYLYLGYPNAVELLNSLGERGVTDAYVLLGHAYGQGLLTSLKDEKMAFAYYLKAANKGSPKGMLNTAELLRSVDFEKSKKFVLAAAEEGSLTAAYMLQDLNGNYRTVDSDKSRSENDVKVLYFWNLVFSSLSAQELSKDLNVSIGAMKKSPFILEGNHEYEYDGVPSTPWPGGDFARAIDAKVVNHFDTESVKKNKNQLEATLNSNNRIQVQGRVRQWISAHHGQSKTNNKILKLPDMEVEKVPASPVKKLPKLET